ncbi:calpain family cysteine protease (macronuclear) [Tetrahymena thermophila SB210]|uniref:Calpain family cysteine protease n=1 Tax=Tetrahymena thermophila (strain SB210) TaxID=312017 RepID=Q22BU2_TETTS|nr:calpain family cysteine protease [Tetrahymena thermophila SB210]EAR82758.2 calpain family cysteine protease [Tetrahymena thermophila SB210]|eukprot:XP_001030421.2 calpain family cysteine protease [Tetrahymena thermophila SB210]
MRKNLNQQQTNKAQEQKNKNNNNQIGKTSFSQAKQTLMNMEAFYNDQDLFGTNPQQPNQDQQKPQTEDNQNLVLQPNQNQAFNVPYHQKSSSQSGPTTFATALNSVNNVNQFYNNIQNNSNTNQPNINNQNQIKDSNPNQNQNNSSSQPSSFSSFSGQGIQIGGSLPNNQQIIKNNNLFERVYQSEDKINNIQQANNNLYLSFSKYFQKEHASLFQKNITDPKLIYHWNALFNSVQSEENLFFNFSKFQNDFDMIYYNLGDGEKFTDQTFPNDQSVIKKQGQYCFKRASEIYTSEFNIFDLGIEPNQIQQGRLGDCYLISSIIAIAEYPEFCARLFVSKQKNDKCVYGIWLCESGEWKQIVIDDYLVCQQNSYSPSFALSIRNGIWVQLLEKAYAKCYGGYGNIEVGYSFDSLRDLTGSPTEYIDIKKNYGEAFDLIKKSIQKQFILTISSKVSANDINSKHSFTIQDAREVMNSKGQQVKLLKLKNPLGYNFQMNKIQDQTMENNIGEQLRQKNGVIWMTQQEVLANFEVVTVCHTHPGYICGSYTTLNKTREYFYIQNLVEGNHCYFSVIQKHEKFYKQGNNDQTYYYKTARLIITQINSDSKQIIEVLGGSFSNKQQVFFEVQNLPSGEFLAFVEIDEKMAPQKNQFTFQTYSKNVLSIIPAFNILQLKVKESELIEIIFKLYIQKIDSSPEWNTKVYDNTKGTGTVVRDFSSLFGYAFISYRNKSVTQFTETIEVAEFVNLDLLDFDKISKQTKIKVVLEPKESKVLLFRILENKACSHSLKFKSTWFFGSGIVKMPVQSNQKPTLVKQTISKPVITNKKVVKK